MIVLLGRRLLLQSSSIVAEFGAEPDDRIYPVQMPDAPTYPLLVLTQGSGRGEMDMQGGLDLTSGRLQVDVYAETYGEMNRLRLLVRSHLHGYRGTVQDGVPCQIQSSRCINDLDLPAPETERAGPRVRRRMLEFFIWYREV
jgi:hypothetical protein